MSDIWWTYPAEGDLGGTVIVTGRDGMERRRLSGRYPYRVEVSWQYAPAAAGAPMPSDADAALMERATDALIAATDADRCAVLTGIYTGEGSRDWVFYTKSLPLFRGLLNRALSALPALPLAVAAYSDPGWEEYTAMREATYIPPSDD